MKISEYSANMQASASKLNISKVKASDMTLAVKVDANGKIEIPEDAGKLSDSAMVEISEMAKKAAEELRASLKEQSAKTGLKLNKLEGKGFEKWAAKHEDYRFELLERMMSMLLGRKYTVNAPKEPSMSSEGQDGTAQSHGLSIGGSGVSAISTGPRTAIVAIKLTSGMVEKYESESVSFSAQASVKTQDGRDINIDIGLNMSRELYSKTEFASAEIGVFCDPLVMNFGAAYAQLTDHKIEFDLDCDGTSDQISTLGKGSGFLAVDWNNDGEINNGGELFGVKSGDGFADLAKHDNDKNGWIDENDEIWDKLRIWTHDEGGEAKLVGIGEVGIGAIYLGNVSTDFTLANDINVNGMVRKTGFFLFEDGNAGTTQHVDLKI